jgi:hypothetical protein
MIYLETKFRMPDSNYSLIIFIKTIDKCKFLVAPHFVVQGCGLESSGWEYGLLVGIGLSFGSCEHSKEYLGSIKCSKFLYQLPVDHALKEVWLG